MKKVIQTIALSAVASSMLLSGAALAAGEKIGVVNFKEVMQRIPQTAAVMKSLEAEFKDSKAELTKLETDIKYNQEKLKRDGALMSAKEKKDLEKKVTDLFQQYQEKGKVFQQKTKARQNQETNKIIALVRQSVDNIAAKGKYDFILEQQATVYSKPDSNITNEVIKQVSKLK